MANVVETTTGGSAGTGGTSTLRVGSKGEDVKALQTTLNAYGFNAGPADGIFGTKTAEALKAFQTQAGIKADGVYGLQSASALYRYTPPSLSTANQSTRSANMMYNETQPVKPPAPLPSSPSPSSGEMYTYGNGGVQAPAVPAPINSEMYTYGGGYQPPTGDINDNYQYQRPASEDINDNYSPPAPDAAAKYQQMQNAAAAWYDNWKRENAASHAAGVDAARAEKEAIARQMAAAAAGQPTAANDLDYWDKQNMAAQQRIPDGQIVPNPNILDGDRGGTAPVGPAPDIMDNYAYTRTGQRPFTDPGARGINELLGIKQPPVLPTSPLPGPGSSGGRTGSYGPAGASSGASAGTSVTAPAPPGAGGTTGGTTGQPGAGGAITPPAPQDNVYWQKLAEMKFEYDPATDEAYQRAAANSTNAVIQNIVGRGGLYSSVANMAVQAKIEELAIDYEELAYNKFTQDRNFTFQLAQFEQQRLTTAWEQAFAVEKWQQEVAWKQWDMEMEVAKFKFAQESEMFDRKMALAAERRANAQLAYQREQAAAAKKLADTQANYANSLMRNRLETQQFTEMVNQWEADGGASPEVAKYFAAYGVAPGENVNMYKSMITSKERTLTKEAYTLAQYGADIGQAKMAADYLDTYYAPPKATSTAAPGSSESTTTSGMYDNYYRTRSGLTADNASSYIDRMNANSSTYRASMGDYLYNKLMSEATGKLVDMNFATDEGF